MPDAEMYPVKSGKSSITVVVLVIAGLAVFLAIAALIVAAILFAKINKSTTTAPPPPSPTIPVVTVSHGPLPPRPTPSLTPPSTPKPPPSSPPPPTTTAVPTTTNGYNQPGWTAAAQMFMQSIDVSVDPCQDFYNFSCNNWIRNHQIPAGQSSQISFGVVNQQILNLMSNVMAKTNPSWPRSVKQAAMAYQACMNAKSSNYDGSQVLNMVNMYGGLPMITNNWSNNNPKYLHPGQLMGILAGQYGINTMLTPMVDTNWKSPKTHMFFIDQATLFFPTIYYTQASLWSQVFMPAYRNLLTNVATLLAKDNNITPNPNQIQADVAALLNFELSLAKMNIPQANRRNYTTQWQQYMSHAAMTKWRNVPWVHFMAALATANKGLVTPGQLTNNTFIVSASAYINKLNAYLGTLSPNASANSWPRVFQNYLMWRLISGQLAFIPGYSVHFDNFKKEVEGVEDVSPSQATCASIVIGMVPYPASRLYIDYHFKSLPSNTRSSLSQMISNVLAAFQTMVSNLIWMSTPTKAAASAKVNGLFKNVAYPDWILNNTLLDAQYATLNILQSDNWMQVMNKLSLFGVQYQLNQLVKPTNRHNFLGPPAIVNAWYQPELNSITFPAGIINMPFYSTMFPNSVNYGAMGVVMGHELTHGFDDEGVQWGPAGALNDWMDQSSQTGFRNMANCVVNEYSSFCYNTTIPSLTPSCINGVRTQGENIADNGGIQAAWYSYKKLPVQPPLPGVMGQFTHDQLYFMSFAQVWCRKVTNAGLQRQLLIDPHSPARFRVIGTIRNFPKFAQAFGCNPGSPMAPQQHCYVWSV